MKPVSLRLEPSEAVVVRAAAMIYAAHVTAGNATAANERETIESSVRVAIALAKMVDDSVQSDDEIN